MTNNDMFKKLVQLTGLTRDKDLMMLIFDMGGIEASQGKIRGWRTPVDNPKHSRMPDAVLDGFLSGLFEYRDMKAEQGEIVFNFPKNTLDGVGG